MYMQDIGVNRCGALTQSPGDQVERQAPALFDALYPRSPVRLKRRDRAVLCSQTLDPTRRFP